MFNSLKISILNNDLSSVKRQLKINSKICSYSCEEDGYTLLHIAASTGKNNLCELFINENSDIDATTFNENKTALYMSAFKGDFKIAIFLIKRGANLEISCSRGYTPLLIAVEKGHHLVVWQLLQSGANVGATTNDGETPLVQAVKNNDAHMLKLLLKAKPDINSEQNIQSLYYASVNGHSSLVHLLLTYGANVNACFYKNGIETSLHAAAKMGHLKVVNILLEAGAAINYDQSVFCDTPLMLAALSGNVDVVSSLLEAGANVGGSCNQDPNFTALHSAAVGNHPNVFMLLCNNLNTKAVYIVQFMHSPKYNSIINNIAKAQFNLRYKMACKSIRAMWPICPISKNPITEPVICVNTGQIYEKIEIKNRKDMTGKSLSNLRGQDNREQFILPDFIKNWFDELFNSLDKEYSLACSRQVLRKKVFQRRPRLTHLRSAISLTE